MKHTEKSWPHCWSSHFPLCCTCSFYTPRWIVLSRKKVQHLFYLHFSAASRACAHSALVSPTPLESAEGCNHCCTQSSTRGGFRHVLWCPAMIPSLCWICPRAQCSHLLSWFTRLLPGSHFSFPNTVWWSSLHDCDIKRSAEIEKVTRWILGNHVLLKPTYHIHHRPCGAQYNAVETTSREHTLLWKEKALSSAQ